MSKCLLYLRHISFIAFLWAMIVLYPGFSKYDLGTLCFSFSFIYICITFIMFFVKDKNEENSLLNNFVLCFLHIYICFLAYRYSIVHNTMFSNVDMYFKVNFFIISLCMFILTINKIILANSK